MSLEGLTRLGSEGGAPSSWSPIEVRFYNFFAKKYAFYGIHFFVRTSKF